MHKIYIIMGKSASGKDTIYNEVINRIPSLHTIKPCTTRPKRDNETGSEYNFVSEEQFNQDLKNGKIIEYRTYNTIYGPWIYYEKKDDIDLRFHDYITISTLEGYTGFLEMYDQEDIIPIYIDIKEEVRLIRAINRELQQETPKLDELARRFIADQIDFNNEKLDSLGIIKRFPNNDDLEDCIHSIVEYIGMDILLRNNKRYNSLNTPKRLVLNNPTQE